MSIAAVIASQSTNAEYKNYKQHIRPITINYAINSLLECKSLNYIMISYNGDGYDFSEYLENNRVVIIESGKPMSQFEHLANLIPTIKELKITDLLYMDDDDMVNSDIADLFLKNRPDCLYMWVSERYVYHYDDTNILYKTPDELPSYILNEKHCADFPGTFTPVEMLFDFCDGKRDLTALQDGTFFIFCGLYGDIQVMESHNYTDKALVYYCFHK